MAILHPWLLFDADGTLFDYETAERKALPATFLDAGLPYTADHLQVYRAINAEVWEAFERGEISQPDLHLARFQRLLDALDMTADIPTFGERYLYNLGHSPDLIDGAEEVVAELAKTHKLYLITNGILAVQYTRLSLSPIRDYIEGITISGEVGVAKPDPRIFDIAFAGMGRPAKKDVLIIGDSLTADIQGGHDYGIDTCWYNPNGRQPGLSIPITYTINSLHELING
ncbi:MAG: YjjG family noncanonical pyrimidine nucleotidase [Candidatus Promineifilaceae bacterium]|jgi:2-haloacid dehalogenase